jgi:hypothetical protein
MGITMVSGVVLGSPTDSDVGGFRMPPEDLGEGMELLHDVALGHAREVDPVVPAR